MDQSKRPLKNRLFLTAFLVLTLFCWCPLGYGSYGEATRIFGIPSWVGWAYVFGIVLFCLEWIYLFGTDLAINDRDLADIVPELEALDVDSPVSWEGGE